MPFIEVALADAKEPSIMDESEYSMRIQQAELKPGKVEGKLNLEVMTIYDDHPDAAPCFTYLPLPHSTDDEKARKFKQLQIKRILVQFDIPHEGNGFDPTDFAGASALARTKPGEYEGRLNNQLVINNLPQED
ncbi:hypothetical protein LCGC14_2763980 [marine sediment metagenome]|uniref:Uncharacterized protein n=1 Tax=marine sediment metagenome TaxID=412755 RepID=A0A0F8ZK41_9ZZZZ